jgi:hypothetical protein
MVFVKKGGVRSHLEERCGTVVRRLFVRRGGGSPVHHASILEKVDRKNPSSLTR